MCSVPCSGGKNPFLLRLMPHIRWLLCSLLGSCIHSPRIRIHKFYCRMECTATMELHLMLGEVLNIHSRHKHILQACCMEKSTVPYLSSSAQSSIERLDYILLEISLLQRRHIPLLCSLLGSCISSPLGHRLHYLIWSRLLLEPPPWKAITAGIGVLLS